MSKKRFKVLVEYTINDGTYKYEILHIYANDIDEINEEYIRKNYNNMDFDFDIIIKSTDDISDDELKQIYYDLSLCARFYERYEPNLISKNSLKYKCKIGSFLLYEFDAAIIYINDKYKCVLPKKYITSIEILNEALKEKYNEEIKDIKIYYISDKEDNDIIFDEWTKIIDENKIRVRLCN